MFYLYNTERNELENIKTLKVLFGAPNTTIILETHSPSQTPSPPHLFPQPTITGVNINVLYCPSYYKKEHLF